MSEILNDSNNSNNLDKKKKTKPSRKALVKQTLNKTKYRIFITLTFDKHVKKHLYAHELQKYNLQEKVAKTLLATHSNDLWNSLPNISIKQFRELKLQEFLKKFNTRCLGKSYLNGKKKFTGFMVPELKKTNLHFHILLETKDFIQKSKENTLEKLFEKTIKQIHGLHAEGTDIKRIHDQLGVVDYVTKAISCNGWENTGLDEIIFIQGHELNSVKEKRKNYF